MEPPEIGAKNTAKLHFRRPFVRLSDKRRAAAPVVANGDNLPTTWPQPAKTCRRCTRRPYQTLLFARGRAKNAERGWMQKQEPPRKSPRRALGARLTVRAINYTYNDTKARREEAGGRSDRPEQKDGRKRPFPYRLEPAAPPEVAAEN